MQDFTPLGRVFSILYGVAMVGFLLVILLASAWKDDGRK